MNAKQVILSLGMLVFLVLAGLQFFRSAAAKPEMNSTVTSATHDPQIPRLVASPPPFDTGTNELATSNAYSRLYQGADRLKLTAEQAEAYLLANHRDAASLLAAARASGDKKYLREAMEKFPNDPRVAFDAYFLSGPYDSARPASDERRKWLDSFKQSDPDNALPNYLAARDDFKSGKADLALQELQAATGKSTFQDYSIDAVQNAEEAYRSAGYSEAEAKSIAAWDLLLPQLSDSKQLSQNLIDLANQYRQSGDAASAQAVLEMGVSLGDRFNGPGQFPLINTLVGIAIERNVLAAMDPNSPYLDTGLTVQQQLDALNQRRASLKTISGQAEALLPIMSDADLVSFYDRLRMFGTPAAVQWAAGKYKTP